MLLAGLARPASAAASTGAPTDWGGFLRGGLIAAGLWIVANLAGHLWIRNRSNRAKRPRD